MHRGPSHLLEGHLLADHHLGHPGGTEVHRGIPLPHHDHVTEGRDVRTPCRTRPEEQADLGNPAGHPHLVEEDPASAASTREHLDLIGDPRPGRIDQVQHRYLERECPLLNPEYLLDRSGPPGARLHGRIVGHQGNRASVDRSDAGDHPVGTEALRVPAGEQAVLGERVRVEQGLNPLAHRELSLGFGLFVVAGRSAREGGFQRLFEVGLAQPSAARVDRNGRIARVVVEAPT